MTSYCRYCYGTPVRSFTCKEGFLILLCATCTEAFELGQEYSDTTLQYISDTGNGEERKENGN